MQIVNPGARSSFLLLGDHAGNRIPARLGTLGLEEAALGRHIAWDIGVAALGAMLAASLDAVFIHQSYSRLVVDCNRAPGAPDAIGSVSDGTSVPANHQLEGWARRARYAEIHEPYHTAIASELMRRDRATSATTLVALHSFTPVMGMWKRPWQIGILHDRGDPAFALLCLDVLRARHELVVGDNEPYRMDGIDYTIPRHAYAAMRPYVEIEIRQDRLAAHSGLSTWTAILTEVLLESLERWEKTDAACRALRRGGNDD